KVRMGGFLPHAFNSSIYVVMIGKRGETTKSSSVDDCFSYFNYIGTLAHFGKDTKAAEGRTLVMTAGSAEGLGLDIERSNCKNALIYYDELSSLIKKARIDCSTLGEALLLLYESKKFSNSVKSSKDKFSLAPGTYAVSMIANCTDLTFEELWGKLNAGDSGL